MLVHPIIDKLQSLRFFGMRTAFEEQMQTADIDQLNFEGQSRTTGNRATAALTVGQLGRNHELALAAHLHGLHALGPALDYAIEGELGRLAALRRAVEHLSVRRPTGVVDRDDVPLLWMRLARAFLEHGPSETRFALLGILGRCSNIGRCRDVGRPSALDHDLLGCALSRRLGLVGGRFGLGRLAFGAGKAPGTYTVVVQTAGSCSQFGSSAIGLLQVHGARPHCGAHHRGVKAGALLVGPDHDLDRRLGLDAVIVNPYDRDSVADGIATAITMPLEERRERHASMMKVLRKNDITAWRTRFVDALMQRNVRTESA